MPIISDVLMVGFACDTARSKSISPGCRSLMQVPPSVRGIRPISSLKCYAYSSVRDVAGHTPPGIHRYENMKNLSVETGRLADRLPFAVTKRCTEGFNLSKISATCHLDCPSMMYDLILSAAREKACSCAPPLHEARILPAVRMIRERFADGGLTVASLASACGVSEVYLRRLFLEIYGVSPKEFLIATRLGYAKDLLHLGEFPVFEVARRTGYSDATQFSRDFKKHTGMPPSLWR